MFFLSFTISSFKLNHTDVCFQIFLSPFVFRITHISHSVFLFLFYIVLDTAAGVWCDTKSVVTTPRTGRYSADAAGGDAAVELTRRCRHAAAAFGDLIFIYGGLRGGKTRLGYTVIVLII